MNLSNDPKKPTPNIQGEVAPLLAFGAHPDDIEFGCGGVVALESQSGRPAHFVVCSSGEAASHGTAGERILEAKQAASILGADLEIIELDGDAHLEIKVEHTLKLAGILRRIRPGIVLAPSLVENQHPDHCRLGLLVRDAVRLARYGGIKELLHAPPHAIDHLLFYAVTPEAEPTDLGKILIDISAKEVLGAWSSAMEAHSSQAPTRRYVELQLTRARLAGLRANTEYAMALYPNAPLLFNSLGAIQRSAQHF